MIAWLHTLQRESPFITLLTFSVALVILPKIALQAAGPADRTEKKGGERWIISLESHDPELQQLKKEVAGNLRSSMRGGELVFPLRVVKYRVRKNDSFYKIMAMVSQNEDTLASWNGMVNPNEIGEGDVLTIPNARGVFSQKDAALIQKQYGLPAEEMLSFGEGWFLPGKKFEPEEREMFRGRGFRSPLHMGRISSKFGYRIDPFSKRSAFHGGLDIAAPSGTPVYATRAGEVSMASYYGAYGKLVTVQHAYGYETYYGHLSRIRVKRGQKVKKGDLLGFVGTTGRSTGPHLHFEVRKNGNRKRPQIYGLH